MPATITRTSHGGFASFPDSRVVVEFKATDGEIVGVTVRDSVTNIAITADQPNLLESEPALAGIVDALRRDTGLR